MERIADSLKLHLASSPEQRQWELGFQAGKRRARVEVHVVVVVLCCAIALLGG